MDKMPTSAEWLSTRPDVASEIWVEPSAEARFLLKHLGWLVSPSGSDSPFARFCRNSMVAPFTQLTLLSFDLQYHLFEVLHLNLSSKVGHGLGMAGVVLVALTAAGEAFGAVGLGVVVALLAAWWLAAAVQARLLTWAAVSLPVLGALAGAAYALGPHVNALALFGIWAVSIFAITVPHGFEPNQPPRTFTDERWFPVNSYLVQELRQPSWARRVKAMAFVVWVFLTGLANETWASPRLLPYTLLAVMFRLGYAPPRWRELKSRADRAWESGNPALDFVGVGGPTYLRLPEAP